MISLDKFPEAIQMLLDRIDSLEKTFLQNQTAAVIPVEDKLMTADEAAIYLGKCRQTIYGLVCHNKIPHYGSGKNLRFSKSDLKNWLKKA